MSPTVARTTSLQRLAAIAASDEPPSQLHLVLVDGAGPPDLFGLDVDVFTSSANTYAAAIEELLDGATDARRRALVAPSRRRRARSRSAREARRDDGQTPTRGVVGAAHVRWRDTSRLVNLGTTVSRIGARRIRPRGRGRHQPRPTRLARRRHGRVSRGRARQARGVRGPRRHRQRLSADSGTASSSAGGHGRAGSTSSSSLRPASGTLRPRFTVRGSQARGGRRLTPAGVSAIGIMRLLGRRGGSCPSSRSWFPCLRSSGCLSESRRTCRASRSRNSWFPHSWLAGFPRSRIRPRHIGASARPGRSSPGSSRAPGRSLMRSGSASSACSSVPGQRRPPAIWCGPNSRPPEQPTD